jgi:hypothetical protein
MASDRKRKLAQVDAHRPQMPRKQPLIFTREDDWEDNLLHLPVDTAAQAGEREAEMVKRLTCTQSTFAATSTMLTPPAELGNSREELASLQSDALLKAAKITELNNCLVISSSQRRSPQDDVAGLETDVANFSTKIGTGSALFGVYSRLIRAVARCSKHFVRRPTLPTLATTAVCSLVTYYVIYSLQL